jgi:hypothetical protein
MKRLRSLFLAILLLAALTSPAWAENDHGARADASALRLASGRVPGGQADPRVTVTPAGGSSQSAIVCATNDPAWASPLPGSGWISLQADCGTSLADSTNYVYSTTFTLPRNHSAARIDGQVLADDSVTIQLNGTTIFTGGNLAGATPFSSADASLFTTGVNTLTFTVFNVTGASGLDYVARVQGFRGLRKVHDDRADNRRGDDRRGDD